MVAFIIVVTAQLATPRLAADLRPGLQLQYTSGGQFTSPWVVDSAAFSGAGMPGADCATLSIRQAANRAPNVNRLCVLRDTLYGWDAGRSAWTAQRPVGPRMTMVFARSNGDTVRYTTDTLTYETISGVRLPVLPTIVLTVDRLGQPKRRLRERYALTLTTATGGVFEGASGAGWTLQQAFELLRIVPP